MKKIVLVTGSTDGIGYATARALLEAGRKVVVHGRSTAKAEAAAARLRSEVPGAEIETAAGDLGSFAEVRALAADVARRFSRLDVLLHNAGVYAKSRTLTVDGNESTFQINHLAPFLLTKELLPLLRQSGSRVVTVSSVAHGRGRLDFGNLNAEKEWSDYGAYALSKLANVLFAVELAEREKGILTSNSLHPGVIGTKLLKTGFGVDGAPLDHGARTSVFLAVDPSLEGVTGRYFSDLRDAPMHPAASDPALREAFWKRSEEMTGV